MSHCATSTKTVRQRPTAHRWQRSDLLAGPHGGPAFPPGVDALDGQLDQILVFNRSFTII